MATYVRLTPQLDEVIAAEAHLQGISKNAVIAQALTKQLGPYIALLERAKKVTTAPTWQVYTALRLSSDYQAVVNAYPELTKED